jgi:polysaccharide export outer membrane protein
MRTKLKIAGNILATLMILAASAAAQRNSTPAHNSPWSAGSTVEAGRSTVTPMTSWGGQPASATLPTVDPGSTSDTPRSANSMVTTMTSGPVNIEAGDLLAISVFSSPEMVARVRVTNEGDISFPLLGKLHVSGMMPQDAQDMIRDQLVKNDLVKNPQVDVFVLEYANQVVYVLGEVIKPGAYPVMGSHQLFDFITIAGSFTARAGKAITITRQGHSDAPEVIPFSRDPNASGINPQVNAGDTIYVGQAGLVYVVGDVARPGGFVLYPADRLTVMKAMALAEGTKSTAKLTNARLVRITEKGREEIPLDLKKIYQAKAADQELQDQDIIYVPNSTARSAVGRSAEAVLQVAVGAAIYRF